MDFQTSNQNSSKSTTGIMVLVAFIVLIIFYFRVGLVSSFFICLIAWIVFFLIYFRFLIGIALLAQILLFISIFILSIGLLLTAGPKANKTTSSNPSSTPATNKVALVPCTSSLNDQPVLPKGWKSLIFSAPLRPKHYGDPAEANNVRTFSLKGLKDKTEKNDMYAVFAKSDRSAMAGTTSIIEVCNLDNKAKYSTTSTNWTPASKTVVEENFYLHTNYYVAEPGIYRIDAYLKIGSGKWQLINRMTGITITE